MQDCDVVSKSKNAFRDGQRLGCLCAITAMICCNFGTEEFCLAPHVCLHEYVKCTYEAIVGLCWGDVKGNCTAIDFTMLLILSYYLVVYFCFCMLLAKLLLDGIMCVRNVMTIIFCSIAFLLNISKRLFLFKL